MTFPSRLTGERVKPYNRSEHARRPTGGTALGTLAAVDEERSRTAALAERLATMRTRAETLPGAPLVREVLRNERELGGGLIAGGVAFRMFLWLVPLGLVAASLLSFWADADEQAFESAIRSLGIGAAAAQAASDALEHGDRSAVVVLLFGLVLLAWFTVGALRALLLAYALAWRLEPPRIRRPLHAIVVFNGLFLLALAATLAEAWLHDRIGDTALLTTLVSFVAGTAVALWAMWLLPHRVTQARELLPGALLLTVGHQLVQIAVVFYFAPRLGRSEETYGAFGAAATMLIWLYVLSRLATEAAFLNATLWDRRRRSERATA